MVTVSSMASTRIAFNINPNPNHPPPPPSKLSIKTNIFFSAASKTRPLSHTLSLLPLLPHRDTVTWNIALSSSLRHRSPHIALQLFVEMLSSPSPSPPDSVTFRAVLRACLQCRDRALILQLHSYILKVKTIFSAHELTIVHTCLLNVYLNLGWFDHAYQLFVDITERDVVAFTLMLKGFMEAGESKRAVEVFEVMVGNEDLVMNEYVYSCALRACAGLGCLFEGRQIHARVVKSGMGADVFVGTGLVDLYVKCSEMESARKAFSEIDEPNVVSYNALFDGDFEGGECLRLFSEMRLAGVDPNHLTFTSVIRACRTAVSIFSMKQLHGLIVKTMDVESDVFLSCALFEAYIDSGCKDEARKVFDRMEEKDDAAYNLAVQGYLRNRHEAESLESFVEALRMHKVVREVNATCLLVNGGLDQGKQLHALIIKFGYSHTSVIGSLVKMYATHFQLKEAVQLFDQIPFPDIVLWTDLISNFSHCGEYQGALKLYVRMLGDGLAEPPNHYTFSTLLRSCAHLAAVTEGKQIHAQIIKSKSSLKNISSDPFTESALLYMYSRCGYIDEATMIFNVMTERDLASWNAMVTSLAQHGLAEEAIEMFQEPMNQKDMEPNHITFVGVLTACSHKGLVELGYRYFMSINQPTIDHYACLVSLFTRAGKLKEAFGIVKEMPFEANEIIWSSLLAASSKYGNIELGEFSAEKLLEINPNDPGTYVALSNLYAAAGRWEDMRRTRKLMKSQADSKKQGVSWLRVDGEKHSFSAAGMRICT